MPKGPMAEGLERGVWQDGGNGVHWRMVGDAERWKERMRGVLTQISISGGGMPKLAIPEGRVTDEGIVGDWQLNRKYHGGPNRAICLYSEELYEWLRGQGIELTAGQLGENFTTRGIDLMKLGRGTRLRVGKCVIEITEPRTPCAKLKRWREDLKELLVGRAGWLAKVISEGTVRAGDGVEVVAEE
ncbi:MAG: MOSC domain-containing protein [Bacillota bacterium]